MTKSAELRQFTNYLTVDENNDTINLNVDNVTTSGDVTTTQVLFTGTDPYLRVNADNKHLVLSGGSGWSSTGATVVLRGATDSTNPHGLEIATGNATSFTLDSNRKLNHLGNWAFLGGFNAGGQAIPGDYGVGFATNLTQGKAEASILNGADPAVYTNTGIGFFQRTGATTYTSLMYLHNNGSVGIGTNNPGAKLDVIGGARFGNGSNDNVLQVLGASSGDEGGELQLWGSTGNYTQVVDAFQNALRVHANGAVQFQIDSANNTSSTHSYFIVGSHGGLDTVVSGGGSGIGAFTEWRYGVDGVANTKLTGNNNSYINANYGNVGVGTSSPLTKLHVKMGDKELDFNAGIWVQSNPSDGTNERGGGITFQNYDVYTAGIYGIRQNSSWDGALAFYTHDAIAGNTWGSSFTEKMRLDEAGRLGIGTTNPPEKLSVDGKLGFMYNSTGSFLTLGKSADSYGIEYVAGITGAATPIAHAFKTSNIGTAMVINYGGNVGIKTANPTQSLDVNGAINSKADDNEEFGVMTFARRVQSSAAGGKIATLGGSWGVDTMATAVIHWTGLYAYAGEGRGHGITQATTRRSYNNTAWADIDNDIVHEYNQNGTSTPNFYWDNGVLRVDSAANNEIMCSVTITYRNCYVTPNPGAGPVYA